MATYQSVEHYFDEKSKRFIREAARDTKLPYHVAVWILVYQWELIREELLGNAYRDIDIEGLGTLEANLEKLEKERVRKAARYINRGNVKKYRNPVEITKV